MSSKNHADESDYTDTEEFTCPECGGEFILRHTTWQCKECGASGNGGRVDEKDDGQNVNSEVDEEYSEPSPDDEGMSMEEFDPSDSDMRALLRILIQQNTKQDISGLIDDLRKQEDYIDDLETELAEHKERIEEAREWIDDYDVMPTYAERKLLEILSDEGSEG